MIEFTEDVDGIYFKGDRVSLTAGMEDAFVEWRRVATYVTDAASVPEVKSFDAPPAHKLVRRESVVRK